MHLPEIFNTESERLVAVSSQVAPSHCEVPPIPSSNPPPALLPSQSTQATCTSHSPRRKPSPVDSKYLQLIKWKDGEGEIHRFHLIDMIANKWRSIGQTLGIKPAQLAGISKQYMENATDCCRDVLGRWLDNPPSDYPVTWDGLVELLRDVQLSQVADELESALRNANLC